LDGYFGLSLNPKTSNQQVGEFENILNDGASFVVFQTEQMKRE
jgi:hypothetical protein